MMKKYASVINNRNSLIAHSLRLLRLSGIHLNLKSKQKVNLEELLNMLVKFLKSPKKKMLHLLKALLLLELKMIRLKLILLRLKLVQSKQLKNHIDSEKLRLKQRK